MGTVAMAPIKFEIDTVPSLPNLLPQEPMMSIQVEDLVQAVAEGVLRAAESRGGSTSNASAAPALATPAVISRPTLITQLTFELRIRAGGIPAAPLLASSAE
jgi:hypothetical protein